jgi:hypothetical protein
MSVYMSESKRKSVYLTYDFKCYKMSYVPMIIIFVLKSYKQLSVIF